MVTSDSFQFYFDLMLLNNKIVILSITWYSAVEVSFFYLFEPPLSEITSIYKYSN